MVKHGNGCVSTYARNLGTRKRVVQRSQQNRRQAVLRRLGAWGPISSALAVHRTLSSRSPPLLLAAVETAGLLAAIGLSDAKYNRVRKGFGAGLSEMASLPQLRQARTLLLNSSAYEVSVEDSGAHRTQLRLAVQERLGRLCAANLFLERPLYDSSGKAIPKTRSYTIPATGGTTYPDGCPPADMLDAQISIGLEKGGSGQLYQRPFRLKFAPRCGNVACMVRRVRIETLYQYKRVEHPVVRPQIEYFALI